MILFLEELVLLLNVGFYLAFKALNRKLLRVVGDEVWVEVGLGVSELFDGGEEMLWGLFGEMESGGLMEDGFGGAGFAERDDGGTCGHGFDRRDAKIFECGKDKGAAGLHELGHGLIGLVFEELYVGIRNFFKVRKLRA